MTLVISTPQVRTILEQILNVIVPMVIFLLSMAFVLWLMTVLEPNYFARWFLP